MTALPEYITHDEVKEALQILLGPSFDLNKLPIVEINLSAHEAEVEFRVCDRDGKGVIAGDEFIVAKGTIKISDRARTVFDPRRGRDEGVNLHPPGSDRRPTEGTWTPPEWLKTDNPYKINWRWPWKKADKL